VKKNPTTYIATLALLAALMIPVQLAAQDSADHKNWHHHYKLVQMSRFGGLQTNFIDNGPNNIAVLNNRGAVSGGAAETLIPDPNASQYWLDTQGDIVYAFLWQDGSFTNLGSLPGTNNSLSTWISSNGIAAGGSENGQIDPSVAGLPEFSAVIWQADKITNLGMLPQGGYQSIAVSVNSRREVAGIATNLVPDANSLAPSNPNLWPGIPYGYQLRAFFWDAKNGMQDLGTLGTGTDAQAIQINERGQVIGESYTSSAPGACYGIASGAFIWDRAQGMVDLGSFGGTCTLANDLNNRGEVVGLSFTAGDSNQRAFLWENGSFRDLGGSPGEFTGAAAINEAGAAAGFTYLAGDTLLHAALWRHVGQLIDLGSVDNDPCAFAQALNDNDQVVGESTDCQNFVRGFLWENGSMVDLNTLIPPTSPLHVTYAFAINARGEIAVDGDDANNIQQAALLIPCDENHPGVEGCDYSLVDANAAVQPHTPQTAQSFAPANGNHARALRNRLNGRLIHGRSISNVHPANN
jgi:probable HAF family extracellular repeat protein